MEEWSKEDIMEINQATRQQRESIYLDLMDLLREFTKLRALDSLYGHSGFVFGPSDHVIDLNLGEWLVLAAYIKEAQGYLEELLQAIEICGPDSECLFSVVDQARGKPERGPDEKI